MRKCWAAVLGNCDKMSREHTITAGIFLEDSVKVKGFSWCKDEYKEIGLEGLTRKLLCVRHNSMLSKVDDGGIAAMKAFRKEMEISNARKNLSTKKRWNVVEIPINGPLLERWFAKTLVNVAFGTPHKIGGDSKQPGEPSERIVKGIFGLGSFGARAGLYGLGHVGLNLTLGDGLKIISMLNGDICVGAVFLFHGFRFFIYFEEGGLDRRTPLPGLSNTLEEPVLPYDLIYRLAAIRVTAGQYISHRIKFKWPKS